MSKAFISLCKADADGLKAYFKNVLEKRPPSSMETLTAIVHLLDEIAEEENRLEATHD